MSRAGDGHTARGDGPLAGLRVVEFLGIGPGPHCAMMLADLGADVLRIGRESGNGWPNPANDRGRAVLALDLRSEAGRDECLAILDSADALIEGFRPGVMERLGLGPDVVLDRNKGLVYGRMTGWGQDGPMATMAGHDINYIALTGVLAAMGKPGEPAAVPLNLVGDFGGGSMVLAFGMMAALWEREKSGRGQIVDAAIVDGVGSLMSFFSGLQESGLLSLDRDRNLLGGAAPFYRCYLCADGREMSVGPLEPAFFAEMIRRLDLPELADGQDPARWAELESALERTFASETQAHWTRLFDGSDACVVPVLTLDEARHHPQIGGRGGYVGEDGSRHPAPAPRLSRTPGRARTDAGCSAQEMIARWREANET